VVSLIQETPEFFEAFLHDFLGYHFGLYHYDLHEYEFEVFFSPLLLLLLLYYIETIAPTDFCQMDQDERSESENIFTVSAD